MVLRCVSTPRYLVLLPHFLVEKLSLRNCSTDVAFHTFELGVHNVLTFSFENDQYTSFNNQRIAIYAV